LVRSLAAKRRPGSSPSAAFCLRIKVSRHKPRRWVHEARSNCLAWRNLRSVTLTGDIQNEPTRSGTFGQANAKAYAATKRRRNCCDACRDVFNWHQLCLFNWVRQGERSKTHPLSFGLSVSVTHDVVVRLEFGRPWWREATREGITEISRFCCANSGHIQCPNYIVEIGKN
jgi:hypothetical protein